MFELLATSFEMALPMIKLIGMYSVEAEIQSAMGMVVCVLLRNFLKDALFVLKSWIP